MQTLEKQNQTLLDEIKELKKENALLKINLYYRIINTTFKNIHCNYDFNSNEAKRFAEFDEIDLNDFIITQPDDGDPECYFWNSFCEKHPNIYHKNIEKIGENIQTELSSNDKNIKNIERHALAELMKLAFSKTYETMNKQFKIYEDTLFKLMKTKKTKINNF